MIHFTYQQDAFGPPENTSRGNHSYDPAAMALLPTGALAFRRGDVSPARENYVLRVTDSDLFDAQLRPGDSRALRTLLEQSRVQVQLSNSQHFDWDETTEPPASAILVEDQQQNFLAPGATVIRSDTGELLRDYARGIHVVDSPRTQGATGWLGGQIIHLRDAELHLETPKASLALTSLDAEPIRSSKKVLISVTAQAAPERAGVPPYRAEPVHGTIVLHGRKGSFRLIALLPNGDQQQLSAPEPGPDGAVRLELPRQLWSNWLVLEATVN
jgi:hypothetical protein